GQREAEAAVADTCAEWVSKVEMAIPFAGNIDEEQHHLYMGTVEQRAWVPAKPELALHRATPGRAHMKYAAAEYRGICATLAARCRALRATCTGPGQQRQCLAELCKEIQNMKCLDQGEAFGKNAAQQGMAWAHEEALNLENRSPGEVRKYLGAIERHHAVARAGGLTIQRQNSTKWAKQTSGALRRHVEEKVAPTFEPAALRESMWTDPVDAREQQVESLHSLAVEATQQELPEFT
ncbi:unnamed protein product, partial [Prorocentrum cordatum]